MASFPEMSVSVRKPEVPMTVSYDDIMKQRRKPIRTILSLDLGLIQHHVVNIEVSNIAHVERHDMVVTRTNVVVRSLGGTVGLRAGSGHQLLDHLEDVSQFARVQ